MPDPTCQDFDTLFGSIPACWPQARGPLTQTLKMILDFLSCENNGCNPGACIKDVGEGTTPDKFIANGWGGVLPDMYTCPILWAISGCTLWVGINKAGCNLVVGTGWCKVCGDNAGDLVSAQLRTNVGTTLSITNATVNRKIDTTEWDDGVGVVLLNSAPAGGYGGNNSFQLVVPGKYLIKASISSWAQQTDDQTSIKIPAWIQDITTPGVIKDLGYPEFSGHAPAVAYFNYFGQVQVQVITPRTFAIQYIGNPGVNINIHRSNGDEIYIQKIG